MNSARLRTGNCDGTTITCGATVRRVRAAKSAMLKGRLRLSSGTTGQLAPVNISVYPSGLARATSVMATAPVPPVRFSTITCWLSSVEAPGATSRATKSIGPPAAKGTSSLIGRVGNSCPRAMPGKTSPEEESIAARRGMRMFIDVPSSGLSRLFQTCHACSADDLREEPDVALDQRREFWPAATDRDHAHLA